MSSRIPLDPQRVAALAGEGKSLRWIGRRLGLAPGTVLQRLRNRGSTSGGCGQNTPITLPPADQPLDNDEGPPGFDAANIRRCRGCGSLVYLWPCLACCLAEEVVSETDSKSTHH